MEVDNTADSSKVILHPGLIGSGYYGGACRRLLYYRDLWNLSNWVGEYSSLQIRVVFFALIRIPAAWWKMMMKWTRCLCKHSSAMKFVEHHKALLKENVDSYRQLDNVYFGGGGIEKL